MLDMTVDRIPNADNKQDNFKKKTKKSEYFAERQSKEGGEGKEGKNIPKIGIPAEIATVDKDSLETRGDEHKVDELNRDPNDNIYKKSRHIILDKTLLDLFPPVAFH
jgi:hypothetical protein